VACASVSRDTGRGREVMSGFPPKSYYTRRCGGGQRRRCAETPVGRERERATGGVEREDGVSLINIQTTAKIGL